MKSYRATGRRWVRFWECERGVAMAEFALAIPFLILLAIGAADYGRIYYTGITVANAARAGAQFGAQNGGTSGATASMIQAARDDAGDNSLNVVPTRICKCPDGSSPDCLSGSCGAFGVPEVFVQVIATKPVSLLIRYPGLPQTLTFRDTATIRVQ